MHLYIAEGRVAGKRSTFLPHNSSQKQNRTNSSFESPLRNSNLEAGPALCSDSRRQWLQTQNRIYRASLKRLPRLAVEMQLGLRPERAPPVRLLLSLMMKLVCGIPIKLSAKLLFSVMPPTEASLCTRHMFLPWEGCADSGGRGPLLPPRTLLETRT